MKHLLLLLILLAGGAGAVALWNLFQGPPVPEETIMESTVETRKEVLVTNGVKHSIPLEEFIVGIGGGDGKSAILEDRLPKDAIPSLDSPKFESAKEADGWLTEEDPGIAFSMGETNRFYPFRILVQHEIVNDTLPSGRRILVTYCPLCLTGFVVDPLVRGERAEFGVSGLLWKSNLVMYDRTTNSLWSQVLAEAVVGPETGAQLELLPSDLVRYGNWKKEHGDGEVLSRDTGFSGRRYTGNVYGGSYFDVPAASRAFTSHRDSRLADDAVVFGVVVGGRAKAYDTASVRRQGAAQDSFGGADFVLTYDAETEVVRMFEKMQDGTLKRVNPVIGFWFSWAAAHPDTEVYQ